MKKFEADCVDSGFRDAVKKVAPKAQKELRVITGEFSALNYYHDLRIMLDSLFSEKDLKFKVYMTNENYGVINKILFLNPRKAEVYLGKKKEEEHFLIADNEYVVRTYKHERNTCGVRDGEFEDEDPEEGNRYILEHQLNEKFDELISSEDVVKITEPDLTKDPIYADLT